MLSVAKCARSDHAPDTCTYLGKTKKRPDGHGRVRAALPRRCATVATVVRPMRRVVKGLLQAAAAAKPSEGIHLLQTTSARKVATLRTCPRAKVARSCTRRCRHASDERSMQPSRARAPMSPGQAAVCKWLWCATACKLQSSVNTHRICVAECSRLYKYCTKSAKRGMRTIRRAKSTVSTRCPHLSNDCMQLLF